MLADHDEGAPGRVAERTETPASRRAVDASDARDLASSLGHAVRRVVNAADPRFVMPIFDGASTPGPRTSTWRCRSRRAIPTARRAGGVKLGDEQFAAADAWEEQGLLALVGIGVEPGMSDVFARYAADELFLSIDEIGVRDGANLEVEGYEFAPTFSIWTTIEECLNPPVIWEKDRGWYTTPPFSEPEMFIFPRASGRSSA